MVDTETKPCSSGSSDSGLGGIDKYKKENDPKDVTNEEDFELPANWPDYDFHRKKSCILNRIFSTCVTKAINHLELVQNAIERKNDRSKGGTLKREVSFSLPPATQQLEIVGQGGHLTVQQSHHEELEDEVLDEVLVLFARLDHERLRLINLCDHEQQTRFKLKQSIDHWRLKRLYDLPLAVQKEHDACTTDITELQWHIAYDLRLAERMLAKIDLARTWHHQLEVEVNDIRQAIPLINEKVSSELVTITAVDDALKETEHELMLSRAKNADTLDKCTRSNQRANTERDEIRGEIEKATKLLNKITAKLQASIDQHRTYEKTIRDADDIVKINDREYNKEVNKRDECRAQMSSLKLKVSNLEQNRQHIQLEIEQLKQEQEQARLAEQKRQEHRSRELDILQANMIKREERLDKIIKKGREKTTFIDEDQRKLEKIKVQLDRDKKTLIRFDQQRDRDAQMLRTVSENLERALYTNDSIGADMKRETERLQTDEDGIRTTMESLRRQIHDESMIINMLNKHLSNDQHELDTINGAESVRVDDAQRKAIELQAALDTLTGNVSNLETVQIKTQDTLATVKRDLLETNEIFVKDKDRLVSAKEIIDDRHQTALTNVNKLETTANDMTTQTAYMKKHIVEMDESRSMMDTLTVKIHGEIRAAETELIDVNYNYKLIETGEQEVAHILQQCLHRQSTTDALNKQLFQERANYLADKERSIVTALKLNTQLASIYRDTLYTFYEMKTRTMTELEHRLDAFARVKDTRQLLELQARLHDALGFYFGIKNEYVEQQLDQLNRTSHHNGLQLTQVQETIQSAVDHISKFLFEQVDFEAVHQEAMLKVHRDEIQEKQQQQVPV